MPPQAFSGGGGGGGGGLVIVEGTAGHEGRIIGRGGAMIRELQDRHGVRIQIKRPEGVTEVSGAGADAAAAEIRKIIADAQAGGGGGGGGPTQPPPTPTPCRRRSCATGWSLASSARAGRTSAR